jgi:hypothetical protein
LFGAEVCSFNNSSSGIAEISSTNSIGRNRYGILSTASSGITVVSEAEIGFDTSCRIYICILAFGTEWFSRYDKEAFIDRASIVVIAISRSRARIIRTNTSGSVNYSQYRITREGVASAR